VCSAHRMEYDLARAELHRLIREREATLAARYLPGCGRILEVGAGAGFQAKHFHALGFRVDALDVEASSHISRTVFPVRVYDGRQIPFANGAFDVVFSSHVLEHVPWCTNLLIEMSRVLKRDGVMIHIIPTAYWRLWTSAAHYCRLFRVVFQRLEQGPRHSQIETAMRPAGQHEAKSFFRLLRSGLLPYRHGVQGNWLTEIYHFSRMRWDKTFRSAQLQVEEIVNTEIFYTGYGIPGPGTSMATRSELAHWLGSSSMIYVLKKTRATDDAN
jgi:SAM-dependent methyltransferase